VRLTTHQQQEQRHARNSCQGSDRQLSRREQRACTDVGDHHQRAAEQRRPRQNEAMIRAEHSANQVRRHQADEADRAGSGHAGRSQNRADEKHAHP